MKSYCIYKHTSPSGKSYIGLTSSYSTRSKGHRKDAEKGNKKPFYCAIRKYGWNEFTHEILKEELTLEEANFYEQFYIEQFNSHHPNGYNLTKGGEGTKGYVYSAEDKQRISDSIKGRKWFNNGIEEVQQYECPEGFIEGRITSHGAWNKGIPCADEVKLKISKSRTGKCAGEENSFYGKKHSPENLAKMSKPRSEKAVQNMRVIRVKRIEEKGKLLWFNDGDGNNLKAYECPEGYSPGRGAIGKTNCIKKITCPHCGKEGRPSLITRYHFDNCKERGKYAKY